MNHKIIRIAARALTAIITLFFALFILEGFSPDFSWRDSVAHLALTLVIAGISAIAWKFPKIGGVVFALIGAAYIFTVIRAQWFGGIMTGLVPLAAGILFLIDGFGKKPQ